MREDIVGMLKNAIERGGRPDKVAESLIASGYNAIEVQQALSFVTGGTLSSLSSPPSQQFTQTQTKPLTVPQSPQQQAPKQGYSPYPQQYFQNQQQQIIKPLPVYKEQSAEGTGKVVVLVLVLLLLVGGLISTIIFKDDILKIFG